MSEHTALRSGQIIMAHPADWPNYMPLPPRQPDMIGMLREWQLDERARVAEDQARTDRLRAWVIEQTGPDGVPVKDWMEDDE